MARPVNLKASRLVKFSVQHHHIYAYNIKAGVWKSIACWKLPPYMSDEVPLPTYPKSTPPGRILDEARLSLDEIAQLADAKAILAS